jgi:hypothetical protein
MVPTDELVYKPFETAYSRLGFFGLLKSLGKDSVHYPLLLDTETEISFLRQTQPTALKF